MTEALMDRAAHHRSFVAKAQKQAEALQFTRWCWVSDMVGAFESYGLDIDEIAAVFNKTRAELVAEFTRGAEYEWMRQNHSEDDFKRILFGQRS